jgi:hypothetical protein
MNKCVLLCFLIIAFQDVNAQRFETGGTIGYGRAYYHIGENNYNIEATASIRIDTIFLWLNSGLVYQRRGNPGPWLNFIKIPIGIDLTPGRKLRFLFGGGLYGSYCFAEQDVVSKLHNFQNFQIGTYFDTGIKYQLTHSYNIFIKAQADIDLSKLYENSIPSHFGEEDYEKVKAFAFTINFGFKYVIPQKNKK